MPSRQPENRQESLEEELIDGEDRLAQELIQCAGHEDENQHNLRNSERLPLELQFALKQQIVDQMIAVQRRNRQNVEQRKPQIRLRHHQQEALDVAQRNPPARFRQICRW